LYWAATRSKITGARTAFGCTREHRAGGRWERRYLTLRKYQIRAWDLQSPTSLAKLIATGEPERRENLPCTVIKLANFNPDDNDQITSSTARWMRTAEHHCHRGNWDPDRVQAAGDLPLEHVTYDPRRLENERLAHGHALCLERGPRARKR